eukprot:gnl/TRDRNA2_/TRDRNA2_191064_c0_seq1.p1 gnl/TRDRNA2_/TRDRNA2_191064_c0~~gnl/TRDRNA2_/TRDRNA2_191064_c0_seq1.p1  ORF type:complete len:405 (-),score=72.27 gnl/TRDRNA2_/TRDRNA2_191064_c0_seq1:84-1199(-)
MPGVRCTNFEKPDRFGARTDAIYHAAKAWAEEAFAEMEQQDVVNTRNRHRPTSSTSKLLLAQLLELGVAESLALAAVKRCSSVEAAVQFIVSHNEPAAPVCGRRFRCPLCFEDVALEAGVTLDCDHRLCSACFGDYCEQKISEGQVMEDELVCPIVGAGGSAMKACRCTITVEQVRGTVSTEVFKRFLEFRVNNWRPNKSHERMVICPIADCCRFVVAQEREKVQCPRCHRQLCLKCMQVDHRGESCEEAARRLKKEAATAEVDRQFEEMVEAQGWTRCPRCKVPTEIESGCYFMQCPSEQCRGRTHFCYLCGVELDGEDHVPGRSKKHFPKGPYNAVCINVPEDSKQSKASIRAQEQDGWVANWRRAFNV